jgi:DNA-binding transcriptional LysR family regulator
MDLDPRLVRYFLAVADELNYGRAAERLHRSQPSLTVGIRRLEELFRVKLFERDSGHVELTHAGRRFVPVARKVLEELSWAADFLQGIARGEPDVFRIGYSPFVDLQMVGAVRTEFVEAGTPAALVSMTTGAQVGALVKGDLHAGLLIAQEARGLTVEILAREPFLVAFNRGHRLEHLERLALSDIAAEPVIWFTRDLNPSFYDRLFRICAEAGYAPKVVQEVGTVLECLQFAAEGLGITFASRSHQAMNLNGVDFRELADARFYFETGVAYRADNDTEALRRFPLHSRARPTHSGVNRTNLRGRAHAISFRKDPIVVSLSSRWTTRSKPSSTIAMMASRVGS